MAAALAMVDSTSASFCSAMTCIVAARSRPFSVCATKARISRSVNPAACATATKASVANTSSE